jgi:hypothetical protein
MWDLNENSRSVAGFRIASTSAAMDEVLQDLQPLQHNVVRGLPLDIHYKTNSASISLIGWVVETLRRRQLIGVVCWIHFASSGLEEYR